MDLTRLRPARVAAWAPVMALGWWVMVEGRPGSWGVGAAVVGVASLLAGSAPAGPGRPRAGPLLSLAGFFVVESLRGGWDVARRALSPRMPLSPGLAQVRTSLPDGPLRVVLADLLSLLPGTLTVELQGDLLLLHALEAGPAVEQGVRDLERRLIAVWGRAPPWEAS